MRISDPNARPFAGIGPSSGAGSVSESGPRSSDAGISVAADQVGLSRLTSQLAADPSLAPALVAKLSNLGAAVSSGRYQVDAKVVSASIIQHSLQSGGGSYA
jgi:hypothetical protein